ncbi:MFS general substrate transporter [Pleurostoma richardsiae]|uniref:MFS general substrate transporter n=1 Tax=Pleurostoma richardsiae TaxID=41990 RepID=A0AA38RPR4_9PEZI|nr:MFS general substrate transporter [Pleurostoma richardsiae]
MFFKKSHSDEVVDQGEKATVSNNGIAANPESGGETEYDELHVPCPPHTTEKRLMSKIDWHILPFVSVLYLMAFLDRVNVANARSFSLAADLDLTGVMYNTALVIFFVPYILFEIPSNILLKRFSPRIWLPLCGMVFGLVTCLQGVVQSYSGLLATRFFLGLAECGMFPGCFYLLGMWYKRHESQKRFSFFFSSTSLAGAFGGLLASAIGKMDGLRGYHGWRWIFIIEGSVTFVICFIFLFIFPPFPEEATWLREDEREYIKARLQADQGHNAAERRVTLRDVATVMKDYKIWLGGFMYFGCIVPAYGFAYFAPTIIQTYHYSAIQTQLHSVPPWVVSFGFSMIVAYLSDRLRHRFLFAVFPVCISIAGFAILIKVHDNIDLEYAALFLVCLVYAGMPISVCWFTMNVGGHHRRSIGVAWQVAFGNIGGIIAVFAFLSKDAPFYHTGYSICISFCCLSVLSCAVYFAALVWENRKRDKTPRDIGLTEYEKKELGDLNPSFRYML